MQAHCGAAAALFAVPLASRRLAAQSAAPSKAVISGPVGPSPYDIVRGWAKPFSAPGFAFGGNSGVFADTPNRIIIAQRGETRLPNPLPRGFAGFAGSIGINVLMAPNAPLRVGQNCFYSFDAERPRQGAMDTVGLISARTSMVPDFIASASARTTLNVASGSSTRPRTRSTSSRTTARRC